MVFKEFSDWQLVKLFETQSNEGAFREILNRYKSKIYSSIYYIIKDHYIAEDIFQETFIKVANTIREKKYKDQGKLGSWIGRIAHNLCIDYIRKAKSSNSLKFANNDYCQVETLSLSTIDADPIETFQTNEAIWKLLNKLPQEQLEVIVLRIYGELSFKEISECMNVSINTSLGRMRYGLINLRKMIEKEQVLLR